MEKENKKQFISIKEILENEIFINSVKKQIEQIRLNIKLRPEPKKGFHYKRDWYNRMNENNMLNDSTFILHIEDIWSKKSKLSSEQRNIIKLVCDNALYEFLKINMSK
jgi:hypothetical protein